MHGGLGGGADGRGRLPCSDRGRHRRACVAGLEPVVRECGEHRGIRSLGRVELLQSQGRSPVPVGADHGRERVGDRAAEQLMVEADAVVVQYVEQPA
jgi:hypothetical protein